MGPFELPWSEYAPDLLQGLLTTLKYTVVSFIGAALLGLVVALVRLSRLRPLRIVASVYTEAFKNVPLLVIIFLVYFGLTQIGLTLSAFQAGTLAFMLFYAAYLSEIFRSAISGIHDGQQEAAEALGLNRRATFAQVIFPQALRLALPGTNTMLVDLLKSTSLLVTIGAAELMSKGQLITSDTFRALEVYTIIAAIYFVACFSLSQGLLWLERQIRAGVPLSTRRRQRLRIARALLDKGVSA